MNWMQRTLFWWYGLSSRNLVSNGKLKWCVSKIMKIMQMLLQILPAPYKYQNHPDFYQWCNIRCKIVYNIPGGLTFWGTGGGGLEGGGGICNSLPEWYVNDVLDIVSVISPVSELNVRALTPAGARHNWDWCTENISWTIMYGKKLHLDAGFR